MIKSLPFLVAFILCVCMPFYSSSQSITTSFSSIYQIDSVEFTKAQIIIPLQFAEMDFHLKDTSIITQLASATQVFIKMYYSKYPQSIDYQSNQQKMLNDSRVKNLFKKLPILESKKIVFEAIRQDNCQNEAEARKLFHGFLINYTQPAIISEATPSSQQSTNQNKKEFYKQYQHFNIKEIDNEFAREIKKLNVGRDSTTYTVFERNFADFDSIVIVADWTSSMQSYTLQLLVWQVKRATRANYILGYVFFNDGDMIPDKHKKIGQTGGIYISPSPNFADALQKMDECKKNGNGGGDFEENNIEVLLKAIEVFPNAKHFIMIADNFGKIKDISLLPKVKKPIHIVLARVSRYDMITPDYVQLALKTSGCLYIKNTNFQSKEELQELLDYLSVAQRGFIPKKGKKGKAPKH